MRTFSEGRLNNALRRRKEFRMVWVINTLHIFFGYQFLPFVEHIGMPPF